MWPTTRPKVDGELLGLFDASARNVQQGCALLDELLADFPERAELAQDILACARHGDGIAHDILRGLAERGARCALESADVHALTGALDDVVDLAEEAADLGPHLVAVHRLEDDADRVVRRALASLFAQGIDPMVVIRWKAIYDTLESAVDACETVVNVLEGMALKQASHR